jgi:hypothetical protein
MPTVQWYLAIVCTLCAQSDRLCPQSALTNGGPVRDRCYASPSTALRSTASETLEPLTMSTAGP